MNRYLTVFVSSLSSTGLPDPFAKIHVDGTAQEYKTEICKASLEPKWNTHYDLYLGKNDNITISIWNQRKVQKRQGSGFLGCVRIVSSTIQRLKDTGCKYLSQYVLKYTDTDRLRKPTTRGISFGAGANRC